MSVFVGPTVSTERRCLRIKPGRTDTVTAFERRTGVKGLDLIAVLKAARDFAFTDLAFTGLILAQVG